MGASMFALWYFISLYLQQVLRLTPIRAGLAFLPMTLTLAVDRDARAETRRALRRAEHARDGAGADRGRLADVHADLGGRLVGDDVLPASFVAALGFGLSFVPVTIAAVSGVPGRRAGLASGLVNTGRQLGGALGLAGLTTFASSRTTSFVDAHPGARATGPLALTHGYQGAFALAAASRSPARWRR